MSEGSEERSRYSSMEKYPPTSDSNSIFHGLNVQCASVKECINYGMNQLSNYFHGMIKDLKKIKVTDEEVHKGKYILSTSVTRNHTQFGQILE